MIEKHVHKLKDPKRNYVIAGANVGRLQQQHITPTNMVTHLYGRTTSGWLHLFKIRRLICYFEYGKRISDKNQYFPIYYTQNNSYITFGFGFLKVYAGFRLSYNRNPKNRKINFYG